jgi:virginiamycin B lyase
LVSGPDGNVWYTENASGKIGRITTSGQITEFPLPTPNSGPFGITGGPDGNLWFTEQANMLGRITTAGQITEFPLPTANSNPGEITKGSDGNLWFTESRANRIGHITPGK